MKIEDLPRYQSHKIVQAGVIIGIHGESAVTVEGVDEAVIVGEAAFSRYRPVPGDYLVVYPDGYRSISPKAAFEDGYIRMERLVHGVSMKFGHYLTEEQFETLGRLADKLDNGVAAQKMNLSEGMHLAGLSGVVREARDGLAQIVRDVGGEDPWATNPLVS